MADVHETRKSRDSWWTVYLVDPIACPVALVVANRTRLTPNALTVISLALGLGSAACLAAQELAAGALLFYLSFMIDCVDGKIARLKGTGTPFGLWLDYVGDRVRVVFCAAGLAYGQYAATGDVTYIVVGAAVAVLDLFRYVNAPQMKRVREVVREAKQARADARADMVPAPRSPGRPPSFMKRVNRFLARRRVRSHVFSGIEFHASVFVVAPLIGVPALVPVSAVASVLLLANELFLIYRLWLFTRRHSAVTQQSREHVLV
ncbi:CDP-alcohol phosphatidyltransferase family protein [Nonomuraea sp. NPDC050536]|uniref:CDP-alcohol phosphatidyltransferase family protein n=1 Tax=Nonomuraea sp. NPDC050536 TaxID=3364366 RepID=UPI0037C6CDEF